LPLIGCGGGDAESTQPAGTGAPKGAPAAAPAEATTPAAAPAADGDGLAATQAGNTVNIVPFQTVIEGPIEYEEGTERPLVTTFPANEPGDARPALDNLPSDDALLGRPLVIDGEIVPFEEIKKQVCLGALGAPEIALARIGVFIQEELQRLTESGAPSDRLDFGPEAVDSYLKSVEASLKAEYPEGDVGVQDLLNSLATSDPKQKLHSQMLFAKLFLPENPADYPPLTLEAILKHPGGQVTLDHYKSIYEESLASGQQMQDPGQSQFDEVILQQILGHLIEVASIVPDAAPGVLYRVNGVDITVDQIWSVIKDRVTTMDVLGAKQWIAKTTLLKKAMTAAGSWLNDEEAYAAFHVHADPYKESIFSIESVALVVMQFPSMERYKFHRRLTDSFQRLRHPDEAELKKYAEARTNRMVGQVSVDADVILCSAWDFKANRWRENGWAEAENRMKDVLRLLVEEQRPWEELVERYSDYYEPPTPVSQRGKVDPNRQTKGRFRNIQRNGMLRELGESDYGMFLSGSSVTDFIFFEQEVGSLGQPRRGPLGWYLPRLYRRTKPPERLSMDEATMKDLVLDDYLSTELSLYAEELVEKGEVYGLEYPGT
jgi:hypothetical protein